MIDEELEIIGLLQSKFNPTTNFVIDLDAEAESASDAGEAHELTKNNSDSKLVNYDAKVPVKIDTLNFSSSDDQDSITQRHKRKKSEIEL